jgi:uncharacterized protein YecT (DUF1311 family)
VDQTARAGGPEQKLIRIAMRAASPMVAGLLLAALPAFAQDETQKRCDGNTREIVECLIDRTAIWEKRMDAAYKQALADAEPKQRAKLVEAQKLWVAFRDANCQYYDLGPGTIASIQAGYCMKDLTKSRALELESATERH